MSDKYTHSNLFRKQYYKFEVDEELVKEKIKAIEDWDSAMVTHEVNMKKWCKSKEGLVN